MLSLHLVSSIICPEGTEGREDFCAQSIPFPPLGTKMHVNLREERGAVDGDCFSVSALLQGAKYPLVIGISLELTDLVIYGTEKRLGLEPKGASGRDGTRWLSISPQYRQNKCWIPWALGG